MRLETSAQDLMRHVEAKYTTRKIPRFTPGDTVRVTLRVLEGAKERLQQFEGVVLGRRGGGSREMLTVRKISFGIGVERVFPIHSPFLSKIEVVRGGKARRAKLYYLREKSGKAARLKLQFLSDESGPQAEAAPVAAVPEAAPAAPAAAAPAEAAPAKAEKAEKKEKAKVAPKK